MSATRLLSRRSSCSSKKSVSVDSSASTATAHVRSVGERRMLWADALTSSANSADRPHDREAEALGLLPASSDCTLPRWILPHLEPLGIHARPANEPSLVH